MKGAIFDLDGTLLDSMWLWESLAENYLLSIGIKPPKNLSESLKDLTLREASIYIKKRFNIKKTFEEINEDMEKLLADFYGNHLQLKPYVLDILKEFNNKKIKMAIATATDEHLVSMALNRHGIKEYFEFIQTAENVGLSKSQPKFFEMAINRIGLKSEEVWVFEDALHCIVSAKKVGLKIVAVKDKSALDNLEEIKRMADIFIEDFSQLEVDKLWRNY